MWCVGAVWVCVGVGWCVCFFSLNYLHSLSCSLSLSFFLHSSLPLPLLSSLFSSRQQTLFESTDQQAWRPTLRRLNVIWRTASAQHSLLNSQHLPPNCTECCHVGDGSLPPPLSSPLLTREKGGNFSLQEYFRVGNISKTVLYFFRKIAAG